jgi:hypothetical protein
MSKFRDQTPASIQEEEDEEIEEFVIIESDAKSRNKQD